MQEYSEFDWDKKLQASEFATGGAAVIRKQRKHRPERPITVKDLKQPNESAKAAKERFQEVTRLNLAALLKWRPARASQLGIEGRWLNRLLKHGLGYPSKSSLVHLERLAKHFGYKSYLDLWREDLLNSLGLPGPTQAQAEAWPLSPHWKQAEKLLVLLDSGDFDHLALLIDDLHRLLPSPTLGSSETPPVGTASLKDFVKKKAKQ